jgi:hypothetical protein
MTAVSLAVLRGVDGFQIKDIAIGTAAPTATYDIELRFNLTDQNSIALSREDILVRAMNAFRIAILQGQGLQSPAGTPIIPQPVL